MCLTVSTADDAKNGFSLPLYTRLFPFHSFYFSKLFHYVCLKYAHCLGKTKARTRTNQAPQYVVLELKIKVGERRAAAESSCPALSFGRCAVHKAEEMLLSLPLVLGAPWAPQGCHSSSSSAWSPVAGADPPCRAMVEQSPQHCQGTHLGSASRAPGFGQGH